MKPLTKQQSQLLRWNGWREWTSYFWQQAHDEMAALIADGVPDDFIARPFIGGLRTESAELARRECDWLIERARYTALQLAWICEESGVYGASYEERDIHAPLWLRRSMPNPAKVTRTNIHHATSIVKWMHSTELAPADMDRVLEIGGGYGNFVRMWRRMGGKGTYVIVDLPAMLVLQHTYLTEIARSEDIGEVVLCPQEVVGGAINLLPVPGFDEAMTDPFNTLTGEFLREDGLANPDLLVALWSLDESDPAMVQCVQTMGWFERHLLLAIGADPQTFPAVTELERVVGERELPVYECFAEGSTYILR